MILADFPSIIYVPPPEDEFGELRFFHASLPDFLLDRSRSKDVFLDEGAAYAKFTALSVKHINKTTPLWNVRGMSFPSRRDFTDSMNIKSVFITHFGGVASMLVHLQSSLGSCVG